MNCQGTEENTIRGEVYFHGIPLVTEREGILIYTYVSRMAEFTSFPYILKTLLYMYKVLLGSSHSRLCTDECSNSHTTLYVLV